MKNTPTATLVSALRVLSVEVQSDDGVANAVLAEAADRMTLLANLVAQHVDETKDDIEQMNTATAQMVAAAAKIAWMRERIKRLEAAGDAMHWAFMHPFDTANESVPEAWIKAKESQP